MDRMSRWSQRAESDVDGPREKSDIAFWVSRQQQLAKERRFYHDRLAWRWLFLTFAFLGISQIPPLWPSIHWFAFFSACIAGMCAFANWSEARFNSIASETWPIDY